jgi:hypothetical protein
MSTKAPTSNIAAGLRKVEESRPAPAGMLKFVDGLFRSAVGRAASEQEMGEVSELIMASGDRRRVVASVLFMEASLRRLAEPWFWKLLSSAKIWGWICCRSASICAWEMNFSIGGRGESACSFLSGCTLFN